MLRRLNHRVVHYGLLLAAGCFVFVWNLGGASLWDVDEGRNSEAARVMMESGNWIVPTFNGELRTDKPALLYWLQISAFRTFGLNEFAARLPSALASILTLLLTYEMGRRMFDSRTGLLAGVVLASTIAVSGAAHFANPDALLCACTVLTFFTFWTSFVRGDRLWLMLCGISTGLGVLAKGPIGLLLPGAVIVFFLIAQRQWRALINRRFAIGILLFVAVAGPWYGWVGAETKGAFLRGFILQHNVERFGSPMENHGGSVAYYAMILLLGLGPWAIFLFPACWHALGKRLAMERHVLHHAPLDQPGPMPGCYRFLWLWIAVYLLFFSIATTKLPNYILPVYPPVALLMARYLERWRRGEFALGKVWGTVLVAGMAACGLAIIVALLVLGGTFGKVTSLDLNCLLPFSALGGFALAVTFLIAWLLYRGRRLAVTVAMALTMLVGIGVVSALALPALNGEKSTQTLGRAIRKDTAEPEIRIIGYRYFEPTLVFYCRREVVETDDENRVLEYLRYPMQVCVVMPVDEWQHLQSRVSPDCRVLATARDLYCHQEVVAITNR